MRSVAMSFILCLLFCGGFVFSQSFFTNPVGQVDAISLASRLRVGMREEDASRFLETNKLHLTLRAGAAVGWDSVYVLTNGCSLHLDTPHVRLPRTVIGEATACYEEHLYRATALTSFPLRLRMRP